MRHAKKAAALLLAFTFMLGAAGCKKKEDPDEDKNAWFDSKTIDIRLPYDRSEYNALNADFVGIIKDKAIVHVNYAKPYPNDFDYEHDDPAPYQGDTLEIYDLDGKHLSTYNLRNLGLSKQGAVSMSSMPGIAGDNVIIPWDSSDGKNCTVGFFDPESGRIVNSYDRQLSSEAEPEENRRTVSMCRPPSRICSSGEKSFSHSAKIHMLSFMKMSSISVFGSAASAR